MCEVGEVELQALEGGGYTLCGITDLRSELRWNMLRWNYGNTEVCSIAADKRIHETTEASCRAAEIRIYGKTEVCSIAADKRIN